MKKLIAIIVALCAISGYSTDVIPEVIAVIVESEASVYEKEKAIEVVTEDLESLYDCLVNDVNPYSKYHSCSPSN